MIPKLKTLIRIMWFRKDQISVTPIGKLSFKNRFLKFLTKRIFGIVLFPPSFKNSTKKLSIEMKFINKISDFLVLIQIAIFIVYFCLNSFLNILFISVIKAKQTFRRKCYFCYYQARKYLHNESISYYQCVSANQPEFLHYCFRTIRKISIGKEISNKRWWFFCESAQLFNNFNQNKSCFSITIQSDRQFYHKNHRGDHKGELLLNWRGKTPEFGAEFTNHPFFP